MVSCRERSGKRESGCAGQKEDTLRRIPGSNWHGGLVLESQAPQLYGYDPGQIISSLCALRV